MKGEGIKFELGGNPECDYVLDLTHDLSIE